ncbi:MAG: hemin-binding protein E, partial [Bartonella sp.]|nr:hemin-binding protein E [Bartonella sp.]
MMWSGKKNTQVLSLSNLNTEFRTIRGDVFQSLKEKWSGATQMRIGLASDRIMPYIAGGVAYAKVQGIFSKSIKEISPENTSLSLFDNAQTMIGYTLGGGFEFAMTDRILLRSEYRYSDF